MHGTVGWRQQRASKVGQPTARGAHWPARRRAADRAAEPDSGERPAAGAAAAAVVGLAGEAPSAAALPATAALPMLCARLAAA